MSERVNKNFGGMSQEMSWEVVESMEGFQAFYEQQLIKAATLLPFKNRRIKVRISARTGSGKTTVASQIVDKFLKDPEVQVAQYKAGAEYMPYYYEWGSLRELAEDYGWDVGVRGGLFNKTHYANMSAFITDVEIMTKELTPRPALDIHEAGLEMGWVKDNGRMVGAVRGSYGLAEKEAQEDPNAFTLFLKAPMEFRNRNFQRRAEIGIADGNRKRRMLQRMQIEDDLDDIDLLDKIYNRDGTVAKRDIQNSDLQEAMFEWLKETGNLDRLRKLSDLPIFEDDRFLVDYYHWYIERLSGLTRVRQKVADNLQIQAKERYVSAHCHLFDIVPIGDRVIHVYRKKLLDRDVVKVVPQIARETGSSLLNAALKSLERKSISTP